MKKQANSFILLNLILLSSSVTVAEPLCDDCFLEDAPVVNADCLDVTNKVQSLEFHVKMLYTQMEKLCDIGSMNDCSSSTERAILSKYRQDIGALKKDVKSMMDDAIRKGCK